MEIMFLKFQFPNLGCVPWVLENIFLYSFVVHGNNAFVFHPLVSKITYARNKDIPNKNRLHYETQLS